MEPPVIRRRGAEDRISGLPDEILHTILSRVPSPAAAARTSVLSRYWRGVWARMPMPDLVFDGSSAPTPATTPSALLDSIDAALKLPAAPTFSSLKIDVSGVDRCHVPAHRISSWLRFASQRVAGNLHLRLPARYGDNMEELAFPICQRATEIDLDIADCFLRPPPTGSFSLLTDLSIVAGKMDGGELGRVVSSLQCPRLRKLNLMFMKLEPVRGVSIHSESLQCFTCDSLRGKLEVTTPMLKEISVTLAPPEACIVVAPKLEKVDWDATYDPSRHQVSVAGRHLRCLSITNGIGITRLMERFDTVSELNVSLVLQKGIEEYMTFMEEMDKLPICETLVVHLVSSHRGHYFAPMMLHLLRRSICIRKFELFLHQRTPSEMPSCTTSDCPCLLPENYRLDDITFDSLEEIGIRFFTGSAEQEEFLELLLSRCNTVTTLKRVDFKVLISPVSSEIMEVVQRIRSMCHPDNKIQFYVNWREVPKP